jgi:hypothetical protein
MFEPPKAPRPAVNETRPVNWAGLLGWLSRLEDGQQRWKHIYGLACVAAKLIAAGEITTRAAWADLMAAAESNGFIADHGARQAERKIARGLRDGAQ